MLPAPPARPIRLYRFALSGHSHRAELFLSLLGLPFEGIDVNLLKGEHKTSTFLALNRFGQVPVIDDDGCVVADSNAILVYLALRYAPPQWLPREPQAAAQVQRWLSAAAGPLAFGPARARVAQLFGRAVDCSEDIERAHALFGVVEHTLSATGAFLTGGSVTIADLALYSYTARAPEGNVPLHAYPVLCRWLQRIEALPGFVPMPASRVGLAA